MIRSGKKWVISYVAIIIVTLLALGGITIYIDPYFHYHAPLNNYEYPIDSERYQNDGIVRHFDYDAIITGTSMTECFKTSEMNQLFGVNAIKVPYSGGSYKEINDNLITALKKNNNVKQIIRSLDFSMLIWPADKVGYDTYPVYLYDDNLINDISYLLNEDVLNHTIRVLKYTKSGYKTTDFDTYGDWTLYYNYKFGKEAVDAAYDRQDYSNKTVGLTDEDYTNLCNNITQNILGLVKEYPDTEFYYFIPPYSIYYFDSLNQEGTLERQFDAERILIEMLIPYDNVHLFSFYTEFDLVCNLDNYKDIAHYGPNINSQILQWMKKGHGRLTLENYKEYCRKERDFYLNYDYESLFR